MNSTTLSRPLGFVGCDRETKISECEEHAGQAHLAGLIE